MTGERLETRGESQQVNAPGRNVPPGSPFESTEFCRLLNAIVASGIKIKVTDLCHLVNTSPVAEFVTHSILSKYRDLLIWLTQHFPSDPSVTAGESQQEVGQGDLPTFAYCFEEEDGYKLGATDEVETIQMAVNDWLDDHEFSEPIEIVVHLGTKVTRSLEHLRFVARRIGGDVLGDLVENKLEDFATIDGDPAFEFSAKDSDALGLAIVENVKRLFPGLNRRYRIDATKDVQIRIVNDGGTWEYAQPAAVPAGESA